MSDEIHKKFMEDINVDFGGRKNTAEERVDAVMGIGGGLPPPPPDSAGFVRSEVDNISKRITQPAIYRVDSPRGKRRGRSPGPRHASI